MSDIKIFDKSGNELNIQTTTIEVEDTVFQGLKKISFDGYDSEVTVSIQTELPDGTPVYVLTGSSDADFKAVAIAHTYNGWFQFGGNTSKVYYLSEYDIVSTRAIAEEQGYIFSQVNEPTNNIIYVKNTVPKIPFGLSVIVLFLVILFATVVSVFLKKTIFLAFTKIMIKARRRKP